jgi:hypothetical protein
MSINISEFRNAQSLQPDNASMDVEINHPTYGWIPYTLDPSDTDMTIDNSALRDRCRTKQVRARQTPSVRS